MEDLLANQQQAELSKLPLFFGSRDKDNFTAEQWVQRVERSKASARWNDVQTMAAVYNAMRGKALKWFACLDRSPVNPDVWDEFKGAFLASYSTTRTSRTTTLHLADLRQGANEPVVDFYPRVAAVIDDIESLAPANYGAPENPYPAEIVALQGFAALAANIKENGVNRLTKAGANAAITLRGLHIFIAGLKPVIRAEMMKAPPADMYAAFLLATKLEKIATEPHRQAPGASIYSVDTDYASGPPTEEGQDPDGVEAECAALAAKIKMLRKKNKPSNKNSGPPKPNKPPSNSSDGNYNRCRYCKIVGHLQAKCFARIKAGAPMVVKQGVPFQQNVSHIGGQQQAPSTSGQQQQQQQQQQGQASYPPPPFNPFAHMMAGAAEGVSWAGAESQGPLNY